MIKPYAEFCRLAQTATSLERYDDAIKVAGAGLVQHPDNVPLMQMLAYALGKGGRHYEAALVLEKILDLGAEVEGVLALLSKNYVDIGIYDNRYWDRAIEYADKSIETDGRDSSGHISKAFICLQRAQYEDAFKLCQDALRVNPESDGGVFNMSIAMLAISAGSVTARWAL